MTHKIEWCDLTINPFTGCEGGCRWCYARRFSRRLAGHQGTLYHHLKDAGHDPFAPAVDLWGLYETFEKLARRRKGKRVFLGSMSDIAGLSWLVWDRHQGVFREGRMRPTELQTMVRTLIAACPQHTFLVLTKRPDNVMVTFDAENLHLGVSVTQLHQIFGRARSLLQRYADSLHWVSMEPLLDPLLADADLEGIQWLVLGAQTGPGAPPPQVDTAKQLVERANGLCIPTFVKENMRKADPAFPWPTELP